MKDEFHPLVYNQSSIVNPIPLLRLNGKCQRISFQAGGEMGFADSPLGFFFGQGGDIGDARCVGRPGDKLRFRAIQAKDAEQYINDKSIGGDIVVVDNDPPQRFPGLFFFSFVVNLWLNPNFRT